jgi:hypothetical protein
MKGCGGVAALARSQIIGYRKAKKKSSVRYLTMDHEAHHAPRTGGGRHGRPEAYPNAKQVHGQIL